MQKHAETILTGKKFACIQNFLAKCEIGTCFGSPFVSRFISFYEDLGTFKVLNSI